MSAPPTTLTIITGASTGIGLGVAKAASADGVEVATVSRRPMPDTTHLSVDLADPATWLRVAEWMDRLIVDASWERVVFVHSAATLTPIGFAGEVDKIGYQTNVLLNSAAPQVLGSAFIESVRRAGAAGILIQISSGAGKNPYPGWTSYCASKAAVDMWVRAAGLEQAERHNGVRVLSLSPGVVATAMQEEIRESADTDFPNVERFREFYAAGALADPDDIGARIWALTSDPTWQSGSVIDLRSD